MAGVGPPVRDRRGLRILIGTVAVGVLAALALLSFGRHAPAVAPDFTSQDMHGQAVGLSALRGRVVLINLWATWCPPCREEMPSMQRMYDRLKGPDFELLAVSEDEGGKDLVEPFVRDMKLTFPVLLDPEHEVGDRYGVWGYPETFVLDRSGRVVERVIGPRDWDAPAERAKLQALISSGQASAAD